MVRKSDANVTDKKDGGQSVSEDLPLVSIGLPVRNGENYISQTITSILGQTFSDFELIISDNASTDRTEEICQQFVARDYRIRYYRNPQNIGAAPNYNRTFELARGRFFKWAAHDDFLAPVYLDACIQALEQRLDAVLCQSAVALIDEAGEPVKWMERRDSQFVASEPSERLAERLRTYYYYDFFGVFRREALLGTPLHGPYHNSDVALLAILALRGPVITVPVYAFYYRLHEATYGRSVRPGEHSEWHTAGKAKRVLIPAWRIFGEIWVFVGRDVEGVVNRLRCYMSLMQYMFNLRTVERDFRYMVRTLAPWAGNWKRALLKIFLANNSGLSPD